MLRSELKTATIDQLANGIVVCCSCEDCSGEQRELLRRLRELVPLLEEMRGNCADWDEDGGFREELDWALALAKGGEER